MYSWRITKYNPNNRDNRGSYMIDEWTSINDIGSIFNNGELLIEEYIRTEDLYIDSVIKFMECNRINYLKITELEKSSDSIEIEKFIELYDEKMISLYQKATAGIKLNKRDVILICKLILRNNLWCKLIYESKMFVHFGYDYYMYIGSLKKCNLAINKITESGLFVEEFESPYHSEEDE
ncbi:hypothetical protein J25TS5_33410 [Paenibacillus faecis]|uniref:hypothetical protein n=1 Tax=Paenibacillus faecis TaxID=862114 RepID=UPI001B0C656D|nr:hypothetical protein [Paenibacillus faecis]GIO86409.1 hypothetical protein J25TS5_33410 [Paenibacillus faecis]